jgi:MFS family permease
MQDILLYGFSTFLPSILKAMKFDTLQSNYLTIPVYLWGAVVFLTMAWFSDRWSVRGPIIFCANFFGIIGYVLLLTVDHNDVKYFATFLCAIAVYIGPGLNLTWLNVNIAPHYRRATAIGFQQSMGNTAGIVAGQIYRSAPYKLGNSFSLGALCVSQVLIVTEVIYVKRLNAMKVKIETGEVEDKREVTSGDQAVDFKYHI